MNERMDEPDDPGNPVNRAERLSLCDANAMLGPLPTGAGVVELVRLAALYDKFGIDAGLVTHTHAWRHAPALGNALLGKELADTTRCRPCWVVLPPTCGELPPPDELAAQAAEAEVAGFRAYPKDHGYELVGPDATELLAVLEGYGAPLLVDADQVGWADVDELARRHPALPLVVTQTGYRSMRPMAGVLERRDNVHVDLSYLGTHVGLEWLVGRFGPTRVLFGTGLPHRDPADAVTRLLWSELDDDQVAMVGGGNLRRLLAGRTPR